MKRYFLIITTALVGFFLVGCGKPCEKLESMICKDLGKEDCALWRAKGNPGFAGSGSRPMRSCINALGRYDQWLDVAKKSIAGYKAIPKSRKVGGKSSVNSSRPTRIKKQHKECIALEEKLCTDLGAEGCQNWKQRGKPGLIDNFVRCRWAVKKGKNYPKYLKIAKAGAKKSAQ